MKKYWITGAVAVVCTIATVIFGVVGTVTHPSQKLIVNMEKAINKNDEQKYANCFLEEDRDTVLWSFAAIQQLRPAYGELSCKILQGAPLIDENGNTVIPVIDFFRVGTDGMVELTQENLTIVEVDGENFVDN